MSDRRNIRLRRSFWLSAVILAAGALSGCATVSGDGGGEAVRTASISYETGPCFGACPVYRVTINANGQGRFEGKRFAGVVGMRNFIVTRAQFDAFERHLRPLRPTSGTVRYAGEACAMMATDLPSADVEWTKADGDMQALHFYFGCDMERNRAIAERLRRAPDLLPIGAFIRRAD